MRVIITGSTTICDDGLIREAIKASGFQVSEIVVGGLKGAEECAERVAVEDGMPLKRFPADWDRNGKRAGTIRNKEMAGYADALICLCFGRNRGTRHLIETMSKSGKPVYVHGSLMRDLTPSEFESLTQEMEEASPQMEGRFYLDEKGKLRLRPKVE